MSHVPTIQPLDARDLLTLADLKAFIKEAENAGATDTSPISNTGCQGMSARSENGYSLAFDEAGYLVDDEDY